MVGQQPSVPLKTVMLFVLGSLVAATAALPVLKRVRPHHDHTSFEMRLKAWWIMAISFVVINRVHQSLSLVGFAGLSWIALKEYLKRVDDLPKKVRVTCYLAIPLQYYWVWLGWYGMFIVFIPVYLFLYPPTRLGASADSIRQAASVHWGLMATVFCVSHAAFLLTFNVTPAGGAGLLMFVTLLTELGDALRLLFSKSNLRLLAVISASVAAAAGLSPYLTPMTQQHALLAGLVLGIGGDVGAHRLEQLRLSLGLGDGPLRPGEGGTLARILALSYTAPLFLHGFRYFYL